MSVRKRSLIYICPFINWDQQTKHFMETIGRAIKIVKNEILFTGVKFNKLSQLKIINQIICTFKGNEPAPNTVHQVAFVWDANSNDLANSQTVLSPVVSSNLVTTQCGLKKHEHFIHVFVGAKTTMEIPSVLTSEGKSKEGLP